LIQDQKQASNLDSKNRWPGFFVSNFDFTVLLRILFRQYLPLAACSTFGKGSNDFNGHQSSRCRATRSQAQAAPNGITGAPD
jgi:hypothetical protein